MEDALVLDTNTSVRFGFDSLNPCFNGRCTSTVTTKRASLLKLKNVLILVLMEDALVHAVENLLDSTNLVLILVLMEDALVRS